MWSVLAAWLIATATAGSGDLGWQGRLLDVSGTPIDGSPDATFTLWSDVLNGTQIGSAVSQTLTATNGYVATELPGWGPVAAAHDGDLWLQIIIDGTQIGPRQPVQTGLVSSEVVAAALGARAADLHPDTTIGGVPLLGRPTLSRAPTGSDIGWPTGTLLTDTDGGRLWVNMGSSDTPDWRAIASVLPDATASIEWARCGDGIPCPFVLPNTYSNSQGQGFPNPNTPAGATTTFDVTQRSRWLVRFTMPLTYQWTPYNGANADSIRVRIDGNTAASHSFYSNRFSQPGELAFEGMVDLEPGTHTMDLWYQLTDGWTLSVYNPIDITATQIALLP